ncbi:hypothetical protein Tco_1056094 [Tanacetum coccineum]|uniref:Uncharacterized protein n=1 Tax=Tanacetum coccineum TaxID=301880 RepID=A0ABQ5H1I8_9ASTR
MDICPRVEGKEFTKVQDDDATLTFLIDLGYKGPLHKYTNMYVDHMHHSWRTLTAIINKCLSGKTIDHRKERNLRRKYMPFHRFTKVIINHFLSQHKSLSKIQFQHYHTIKNDSIVSRLKFVRIGEDYQEYGLPILDMMLNDTIKRSESYQMFLKYSTGHIPPKKSRGKGSQGKKTADTPVVDVDVSEESDSEPARKRTASRRVVNKKVIISAADNIIPDLNATLELGKSISLTEASKEEAARQVHAIHARIVSKKVSSDPFQKLKGVQSITLEEQEATDTMQALKESKKTSKRQPCTGGTSEGNGRILGVPDESTIVFATSVKELIDSDKDKENKDDTNDDKSINLELTDDEETDDEFVHGVEQVNDDEDEEMTNVEVEEFRNTDEENTDAAKTDAGKTEEVKDDAKKAELPSTSSGLSVSSGFGDQFLKLSSDTSLVSTVKDTTNAEINSLLDIKIQYEGSVLLPVQETPLVALVTTLPLPSVSTIPSVPYQTTAPIPTPPITTDALTITIVVPESDALSAVQLRVTKLEKDVSELKKIDYSAKALAALKHTANLIQKYSVKPAPKSSKIQKPTINLEQESKKNASEIHKIKREQAENQKMPKYTIKSTDKATLKAYDLKSNLYQTMHENKSFNRNPTNHALYHALMKALIEDENAMDKGVVDTVKNHKRQHDDDDDDDDEDPSAGPNQGKKTKRQRTKDSKSSKKPSTTKETPKVEETTAKVVMDDAFNTAGKDVVRDDDQTQDTSEPKTNKTPNQDWFKQPPRPPTHDLE